jgi:hypothetical protein
MSARAPLLALVSAWTLWHDVSIYHAPAHTRLGGTNYAVAAYATEAACAAGQREARMNELPRRGPLTELLADGLLVWDRTREHYTTFRYRCARR